MGSELLEKVRELARTLPVERFVARFPWDFLGIGAMDATAVDYATHTGVLSEATGFHLTDLIPLVKTTASTPNAGTLVVGRSRACDITLPFASVSKIQARLHVVQGHVQSVEDAKSHNGTWVYGERIPPRKPVKVRAGDVVTFGSLRAVLLDAATLLRWLKNE